MSPAEKTLVESVRAFLDGSIMECDLGVVPDEKAKDDNNPKLRGAAYLHGHIDQLFTMKAAELTHHTPACAAFHKVHSYKNIDDQTFHEAMNKELTAMGVPAAERKSALDIVPKIIEELNGDEEWCEQDFGYHPQLDEIMSFPDDAGHDLETK